MTPAPRHRPLLVQRNTGACSLKCRKPGEHRDVDIYICGLRKIVYDLPTKLREAGLDRKRTIYEKYD